ncbi:MULTISPECIES: cystathionine beta-lyase [Thalassospira]|uniref:cystathionine beta-lyase n=1 Tax=Thalassospira TaxID=168934 RepID=UPI0008DCB491|nr:MULTISPECIES: cystathionine beta-lyase [Thalassospira]MAB35002.1 cystathionine beta-lyase [Thalassospira sp.]MDM7976495.1 cystathionine beta-lyase [Thalassospira xiamenensis]OHY97314.1 cystathionine beta-lyase [Thalassospira sp. MIT1004]HBS22814.1 cystathionine beta-lyase [Thalassospira sp.]
MSGHRPQKPATQLVHAGRRSSEYHGVVNPPVLHASTILFESLADLEKAGSSAPGKVTYGRHGTPTRFLLEEAVAELEGGFGTLCVSSGVAAITNAILAFVKPGDHILVTDSTYYPTRNLCNTFLKRFGVETEYYDPAIGGDIAGLIRDNTALVWCESPGSLTFEMQDIPAISAAARARGVKVLLDNTWASPMLCRPFDMGVDVSVQAGTKYIVGHSDVMLGTITTATEEDLLTIKKQIIISGDAVGPDDCYLAQRGLRTLGVRLRQHHESGLKVAQWLQTRSEVKRVLHPALPDDPGHAIWKRDFTGASGLFSFILKPVTKPQLANMVDHMDLFGMGFSWGGFESLILPSDPKNIRTATKWDEDGQLIRLHVGLEDTDDLIADLEAGLARLAKD